jgi:hypothetical protein
MYGRQILKHETKRPVWGLGNVLLRLIASCARATSPNWNLAEAGVSATFPEEAGPRLQQESLASD